MSPCMHARTLLPLCACGGLQIRTIDRVCEIPHEGPFCDLMWSDPEEIDTWAISPRGAGWLFGRKVTAEFNQINGGWVGGPRGALTSQARKSHLQWGSIWQPHRAIAVLAGHGSACRGVAMGRAVGV